MKIIHTQDNGNLYNRTQISAGNMQECYFDDSKHPDLHLVFRNTSGEVSIELNEYDLRKIADVINRKG